MKGYGIRKTCWVVVRNTYIEFMDTTWRTCKEWFGESEWYAQAKTTMILKGPEGFEVDLLRRGL